MDEIRTGKIETLVKEAFTYYKNKRNDKANIVVEQLEQAMIESLDNFNLIYRLGILYKLLGSFTKAAAYLRQGAALKPKNSGVWRELGNIEFLIGNVAEALGCYQTAVSLTPEDAVLQSNLGFLFNKSAKYEEALQCFDRALSLQPENQFARCNRYHLLLKMGDYRKGFAEMEYRWTMTRYKKLFEFTQHLPRWNGEGFRGKRLLVHHEQGFGDAIMFIRYLPLIKARGGEVILSAPKPLIRLFSGMEGLDSCIEHTKKAIFQSKADLAISLMSLPFVFCTTMENVPGNVPYLPVDMDLISLWKPQLDSRLLSVGIVWAANPAHSPNSVDQRTCGLAAYLPLTKVAGIKLYSLQKEHGGVHAEAMLADMGITDYTGQFTDFADTAAFIAGLDLVISVDTAVAHLAGALGKPVWVLLPYDHSWRWVVNRTDSPWYPTAKIFRQFYYNQWNEIIKEVAESLMIYSQFRYKR